jgi:hypothetical protein
MVQHFHSSAFQEVGLNMMQHFRSSDFQVVGLREVTQKHHLLGALPCPLLVHKRDELADLCAQGLRVMLFLLKQQLQRAQVFLKLLVHHLGLRQLLRELGYLHLGHLEIVLQFFEACLRSQPWRCLGRRMWGGNASVRFFAARAHSPQLAVYKRQVAACTRAPRLGFGTGSSFRKADPDPRLRRL